MLRKISSPGAVEELLARAARVDPARLPRWGRLNAREMLCHLTDVVRVALGEIPGGRRPGGILEWFPLKQLVVHVLPWPKGVPVTREVFATKPTDLEADLRALDAALRRFQDRRGAGPWSPHPVFGALTANDWDRLMYRHVDHHLRQFHV